MRAALGLLLAGLLAACTPATPGSAPPPTLQGGKPAAPLTAGQMRAVVAATMSTNNTANEDLDLSLLRKYEGGSALAIDSANYLEGMRVTEGCGYQPFEVRVAQVAGMAGGSYPQEFLAVGNTVNLPTTLKCSISGCPNAGSMLVFARQAPSQPWRIVLEPVLDSGPLPSLLADGATSAALTPAEAKAVGRIPADLSADLLHYETTGHLRGLERQYFAEKCWALPNVRANVQQSKRNGVVERESFTPAGDTVAYPLAGGGLLAVFTLDFTDVQVPSAGSLIVWANDANLDPLTALLPSGEYRQVVERGALEVAVELSSSGRMTVVGDYEGVTRISGRSASRSSGGSAPILFSYVARVPAEAGRIRLSYSPKLGR
jgi:hypothetical protein